MTLAGLVAGGCRPDEGGDDAARPLVSGDGTPDLRHVAETLAEQTDRLVVTCSPDRRDAVADALDGLDARIAPDPTPAGGPAATLRAGLRTCGRDRAVVVAPDVATVDGRVVDALVAALDASDADAAVPTVDGRQRPLCAAYDVAAAVDACTTALRYGEGSIRGVPVGSQVGPRGVAFRGVLTALSVVSVDASRLRSRADSAAVRRSDAAGTARAARGDPVDHRRGSD
ncbi:nucleotidyltransferase family protein [Halostella salina]|uniref:nucleotidyltransferase family protein n=1 Tax=Halostella salina TaxID=1547897 RepID=UPI0013CEF2FE|nr:nucleotidyltransferase family protein [Halostella salina]